MNWHKYHGSLSIRLPRYLTSMLSQPSDSSVPPFTSTANNWQRLPDKQAPTLPPRTPTLNPSSLLNGPYSTRCFILFVGTRGTKQHKNTVSLGLRFKAALSELRSAWGTDNKHPKIQERRVCLHTYTHGHALSLVQSPTSVIFHTLLNP